MSHTYAELDVSAATYTEIAAKLRAAGYDHAFIDQGERSQVIDMHGIGLVTGAPEAETPAREGSTQVIEALAILLAGPTVPIWSIGLSMAGDSPMAKLAKAIVAVREHTGLFGYPTVEEAQKTLTILLTGKLP